MEPEHTPEEVLLKKRSTIWNTVTPLSKYLALALFVALPFIGGYVGYFLSPEKVVQVVKVVEIETNVTDIEEAVYPDFTEKIYNNGKRPFLFSEPSERSLVLEHGGCEPYTGGFYEYTDSPRGYHLISSFFVDKKNPPCYLSAGYLGTFGSKYYFSEGLGRQQLYMIDVAETVPTLTPLNYSHIRVGPNQDGSNPPEHLLLVRAFDESALSIFDMNTGTSREIYNDPDYDYLDTGLGMFVSNIAFTEEEITLYVIPYGEPDETGRREQLLNQTETVTISLD